MTFDSPRLITFDVPRYKCGHTKAGNALPFKVNGHVYIRCAICHRAAQKGWWDKQKKG